MRRAFSLIEILVVVAIIAGLAALLFPVVSSYQRHAVRSRCQALLVDISSAVRMYQQDRSVLPTCAGPFATGGWTWAEANARMLFTELVGRSEDHRGNPRPGYLAGHFKGAVTAGDMLNDPWGRPVIYYARDASGQWGGATPYQGNFAGFELWSAGPDRTFADLRANPGASTDADTDNVPARIYDPGAQR
jgi:prepilin-type N-terminal cleavage/methylation domain-containing protein